MSVEVNVEKLKKLTYPEVRDIVSDRISLPVSNVALCAKMGKNEVRINLFSIEKALKGEHCYALVPKSALKNDDGWLYDMNEFNIYQIDKQFLLNQDVTLTNIPTLPSGMVSIRIHDDALVYNSNHGERTADETKKDFTLREQACLMLSIPESGTQWLDELIAKRNRNRIFDK